MAIEVGEAYVSIIPSARGFAAHLHNLISPGITAAGASGGDSAGSSFIGAFAGHMGRLAAIVASAFAAAGISKAISEAFSVTADFETTQVAFTGMLGSVEAANAELAKLQKFAQKTPFEFPELAEASKKLLAVGFDSERIIPIMTQLGNAAAAVGAKGYDINLVVRALGQIKGKGRVMQEELNQIAEALPGFNPLRALADETGIAFEDLQNNIGKPGGLLKAFAIDGDQAVEAILKGMEKIRGAEGAMDRQNKTLHGSLTNLRDQLRQVAIATLLPFFPGIADFILNTVVPWVAEIGEKLPGAAQRAVGFLKELAAAFMIVVDAFKNGIDIPGSPLDNIGRALRSAWEDIKTVFTEVKDGLKDFIETLKTGDPGEGRVSNWEKFALAVRNLKDDIVALVDYVKANRNWIEPMLAGLATFATTILAIVEAQKALATVKGVFQGIIAPLLSAGPLGIAAAAIIAVGVAAFFAYQKFEPFRNIVDSVVRVIRDVAIGAFNALMATVHFVASAFDTVRNAVDTLVYAIQVGFATAKYYVLVAVGAIITALTPLAMWFEEHLVPALAAAVEFFIAWGTLVFNTVSSTVSTVISILQPFVETFINIIQTWFTIVTGIWEQAWNAIVAGFTAFVSIAGPIWSVFWENVQVVAETIFNLVRVGIESVLGVIQGIFTAATGLITGDWGKFWEGIKTVATTLFNGAKEAIQIAIDAIVSIFQNGLGGLGDIVSGAFGAVEALLDGFVGALEAAADTIANTVGRIKDAISSIPGAGVVGNIAGALFGAEGGIVRKPTLMVVGEAGPEAVVPLGMFGAGGTLPPLKSYVAHATPAMSDNGGYGGVSPTVIINAPLGVDRREVIAAVQEGLRQYSNARGSTRGSY